MNYQLGMFVNHQSAKERFVRIQIQGNPQASVVNDAGVSFREILEKHAGHRWILDLRYCSESFAESHWLPRHVDHLIGSPGARIAVVGKNVVSGLPTA